MADETPQLGIGDALVVVDVQNDFCPGGALAVEEGEQVVPVLNRWIEQAGEGTLVIASRDWHPPGHVSFHEQGGDWPAHCLQHTEGAAFHPDLQLPENAWIVEKGHLVDRDQYSALEATELIERLRDRGVRRLWIGGLALDVCVRQTTLDALHAGFEAHLIEPATRAVNLNPDDGQRTLEELQNAGAIIEKESAADV